MLVPDLVQSPHSILKQLLNVDAADIVLQYMVPAIIPTPQAYDADPKGCCVVIYKHLYKSPHLVSLCLECLECIRLYHTIDCCGCL